MMFVQSLPWARPRQTHFGQRPSAAVATECEIEFRLRLRWTGEVGRRSQLTRRADQRIDRMALSAPVQMVDPIPFVMATQQPGADELRDRSAEVALAGNARSRHRCLFDDSRTLSLIDRTFAVLL